MGRQLKELRQRIRSTGQIQKVTSAMQKIASSRLGRDRRIIANSSRYSEQLRWLAENIAASMPGGESPFLQSPDQGKVGLLVFGPDRGLCGGFNNLLMDSISRFIDTHSSEEVHLLLVGKVLARRSRQRLWPVDQVFPQPAHLNEAELPVIREIATRILALFLQKKLREVHVLYFHFISGLNQEPVTEQVLPVRLHAPAGGSKTARTNWPAVAIFEPAPDILLERLLPEVIYQQIFHAFVHSLASEDAARQIAMSRATENASTMLNELTMTFNRQRQENITTEMIELAGSSIPK